MKIYAYSRLHTVSRVYLNCAAVYADYPPSGSIAGYVIDHRLPTEEGEPEPALFPGVLVFDYLRMSPRQRRSFLAWLACKWTVAPPVDAFFDQIVHALEANVLLIAEPDYETIPLLIYLANHYATALDGRQQLDRVKSLLLWVAVGASSGNALTYMNTGPWRNPETINAALSALQMHHKPLTCQLAHRLCCILFQRLGGNVTPAELETPTSDFAQRFDERWPEGMKLEPTHICASFVHTVGHPDTARLFANDPGQLVREGCDFIGDPLQFDELLSIWLRCRSTASGPTTIPLGVEATAHPVLRLFAQLEPGKLDNALLHRIRGALPYLLESASLADLVAEAHDADFDDISFDRDDIELGDGHLVLPFTFQISALPNEIEADDLYIQGEAIALLGAGGSITFNEVSAGLEPEDCDEKE